MGKRKMAAKTDKICSQSSILLCIDLQTCYYQPPITELFPKLEQNVRNVLGFCRDSKVQVVHVRQEDLRGISEWLPWWEELHPDQVGDLGVPSPLKCSEELQTEPVFIKNTFDGFYKTGLDKYLREKNVKTVVVMGLITRACVLNTIMSAFNSGYRVLLLGDCCGDRSLEVHQQILSTYDGYNCRVIESTQLLNMKVI